MATRSLSSRLKELSLLYDRQINKLFESKRVLASELYDEARDDEIKRITDLLSIQMTELFKSKVEPEIYISHKSNGRYISVSFEVLEDFTLLGEIHADKTAALRPICIEEREMRKALEVWKERSLLTGEIVPFNVPSIPEEYNKIGCGS